MEKSTLENVQGAPLIKTRILQPSFIVSVACLAVVSFIVFKDLSSVVSWSPPAYRDHVNFLNLTSLKTAWDIQYGSDSLRGKLDCGDSANQAVVNFKRVLPNQTFGKDMLVRDQTLIYKVVFALPESMVDRPIGLHSLNFFSKNYEYFVNGKLTITLWKSQKQMHIGSVSTMVPVI